MENQEKNKRVVLVEETFNVKLPELKIYQSSIEVVSNSSEKDGILYPGKWQLKGNAKLLPEFLIYLPKEGSSVEQALKQLDVCTDIAFSVSNDYHKLYGQDTLMQVYQNAVLNCIYIASQDFVAWSEKSYRGFPFYYELSTKISIFNDGFSRERPSVYFYEEYMRKSYLRLLLENGVKLYDQHNDGEIYSNLIYTHLCSISLKQGENISLSEHLQQATFEKCNNLVLQLEKIVD